MIDKRFAADHRAGSLPLAHAKHASLRRYAVQHKGYALAGWLKNWGQTGDWERASSYAWEALGWHQALKWLGFCLYGSARRRYQPAARWGQRLGL